MKRSTPNLRNTTEIKADNTNHYGGYIKKPNNINPIFLRKPYENAR